MALTIYKPEYEDLWFKQMMTSAAELGVKEGMTGEDAALILIQ